MLKLVFSKTIYSNLSIFQNDKGEYWGIEQDSNGRYLVNQYSKESLKALDLLKPELCNEFCPKIGENPFICLDPGLDKEMVEVPKRVIEAIFGTE